MSTAEKISNTVDKATDKASKVANQAADTLSEKGEQLKNIEERLVEKCIDYTRENPLTSVGIALGVGFILSALFKDR
jgi:ElaB/YqjD/DUF883 family membrane-anchored ribosome-binding protein